MNLLKIQSLLNQIENAAIISVADSPYLHSCEVFGEPEGKPDEEILLFNWHDDSGLEFEVRITEKGLDESVIDKNKIICQDMDGERVVITLYDLVDSPVIKIW